MLTFRVGQYGKKGLTSSLAFLSVDFQTIMTFFFTVSINVLASESTLDWSSWCYTFILTQFFTRFLSALNFRFFYWGDIITTKLFHPPPSDQQQCFSPHLKMCRGVTPYDITAQPNIPGITSGSSLEAALPYFEMIAESKCSPRAKQFLCSLLEPECQPNGQAILPPCRKACKGKKG